MNIDLIKNSQNYSEEQKNQIRLKIENAEATRQLLIEEAKSIDLL